MWKQMGLAFDLKQFKQNEIEKGRVQQLQKKLDQKRSKLDWVCLRSFTTLLGMFLESLQRHFTQGWKR